MRLALYHSAATTAMEHSLLGRSPDEINVCINFWKASLIVKPLLTSNWKSFIQFEARWNFNKHKLFAKPPTNPHLPVKRLNWLFVCCLFIQNKNFRCLLQNSPSLSHTHTNAHTLYLSLFLKNSPLCPVYCKLVARHSLESPTLSLSIFLELFLTLFQFQEFLTGFWQGSLGSRLAPSFFLYH